MPRRTIIIISIISILIIAGFFIAAIIINREEGQTPGGALRDILPFGEAPPSVTTPPDGGDDGDDFSFPGEGTTTEDDFPVIRKITDVPVAGMRASSTATTTKVRYIERRTGHVYELAMSESEPRRLTNTTIPGVHKAIWGPNGRTVIIRYLDENRTIKSFLATIQLPETLITEEGEPRVGTLTGSFLPDNIAEFAVSPNKTDYAYLHQEADNAMAAVIAPFDTSREPTEVFSSPFTEWTLNWAQTNALLLTTRPSSESEGVAYSVSTQTGGVNRLLGGAGGFMATQAPNGLILFVEGEPRVTTSLYNPANGETSSFGATTLPDKCLWEGEGTNIYCGVPERIPSGDYPDDWYKGRVSFSDRIEYRDTENDTLLSAFDLTSESQAGVDVVDLQLSANRRYLFFRNKKDGTLWSIRLEN